MRFLSFRKPRSLRRRLRSRRIGLFGNLVLVAVLFGVCAVLAVRLDNIGMRNLGGVAIIHDGDTLTVGGERIRLSGIDAFELDQVCSRNGADYSCGERARALLQRMLGRGPLHCEGKRRDRYDRLLAVCAAGDIELNRELVAAGWAVSYGAYQIAETAARINGRGAWEGEFVAPAVWRATKGRPAETRHDFISRVLEAVRQYLF